MKTFSKRFLTILLAVSMVFGLSGMTTFAAEAEDAGDASAEALSAVEENTEEAAGSEAASESETEADNTAAVSETVPEEVTETAVVSEDGNEIATYEYNGEYPDIPVYKNGEEVYLITGEHFEEVEKNTPEDTFRMYRGNSGMYEEYTEKFILVSSLLESGLDADPGCGALMEDTPWPTMEDLYIYMTDSGTYRMAVNGATGSEGWYNGVTKITLGHDYDANGDCLICGHNQLDFIDYNVKYAVCIWGIEQNEDRYGNTLGLTFGPATGGDYTNDYVAHISQEDYEAGNICLHWMTWDEIIEQSEEDPKAFDDCFKNGCTHSVNLKLNTTLLATTYQNQMNAGDGAGMLYNSLNPTYRCWNTTNEDSVGWPASLLRATLNGKDNQTGDSAADALDSSDCLLSCFPTVLQDAIVATAVTSDTVSGSQAEADAQTTYDKLWVPSGKEVYGEGGDSNAPIRANEGALSQRSAARSITTTDNYALLANCDETGTAGVWRLRSLSTDSSMPAYVYQVAAGGNWGYNSYNATEVGVAPCFCLLGSENAADDSYYDVKYAVSVWGINHDIDEEGYILGLTFGPATGADYRHDYVAHISETEYQAKIEAGEKVYCIHWMTWAQIAEQAAKDPTVFQECLEKGCTHSVNLTLNNTIMGASYANQMNDGDGVSGLLNCIKLWNLDPPYEYISTSYRQWNSSTWTTGGWPASQIRAVLNGEDDLLGEYADNALDEEDCLFSCFPYVLQKAIVPKAVPSAVTSVTVRGNDEDEDIMLTSDSLWLFSPIEIWDYSGVNSDDSYLTPAEGALYERSALRGCTTAGPLGALQIYDEEGAARTWFLRTFHHGNQYADVVNNSWNYPTYTSTTSGSTSCAPGFCLGITDAVAGDKNALKAEYDEDSALDEYNYTAESWADLATALAEAKALLDKGAVTEDVLDAALKKLTAAREALEKAVNKTKLQAEYEEDILLKEDRYTAESWKPFADALSTAADLLEKKDLVLADQDVVDAALLALQNAKAALVRDFENSKVSYAVKIWGIGADKYSYDDGDLTYTTGLTFGPATGAEHIDNYVSCGSEYCIHDMTWEEIIEQSKEDPSVFESCLEYGCTKAVELTPNEKLFSMTTLDNYLDQGYTGDGVGTLYYLLNGTESAGYSYGTDWNYSTSGYSGSAPANLYSESRIRVTLNGDSSDANLKYASSTGDGSDLCDDANSLLSCLPEDLQSAIVPRETKNDRNATTGSSADDKTTYDKLFLFSTTEAGLSGTRDGSGGNDYGICSTDADRIAYEFSGTDASGSAARAWWSRSRYISSDYQSLYVSASGSETYTDAGYAAGLSPCFCLAGPESVVNKTELQAAYEEAKELNQADYTSWSWKKLAEAMEDAEGILDSATASQKEIDAAYIALRDAMDSLVETLDVSFTSITAEGVEGDNVTLYYGASIELATDVTYKPSDATLAYQWYEVAGDGTEMAIAGETKSTLTLSGAMSDSGTYKCVVTASSDRQEALPAESSITVTITDEATVNYAVKIWGIGHDTYSYETKKISHGTEVATMTAGLTFGPATGDNEKENGEGFLNTYKAHLTEEQCNPKNGKYCIHWMSWEEIVEQSKTDPSVFDDCMENGCTKAVEISLNEKLANRTTVNSYLNQNYTGDGVAALYYLLNGTNSCNGYTYGANWNYSIYSLEGDTYTDRANLYSRSRIRATLTGDSEDARAWVAATGGADYYDLATVCDETNCLFSCFPEELQEAIVPRLTLNSGGTGSGNDPNADKTDTFDKLFLFSLREVGGSVPEARGDYDDAGGTDYGINESDSDRIAYEFTGTSATGISGVSWWTRSRYDEWSHAVDCVNYSGSAGTNTLVYLTRALAPGFSLPGPEDATVTPMVGDVTVTSDLKGNGKVYDSKGVTLTVSATATPVSANVSYQWYKKNSDGDYDAIDYATGLTLALDGNVSDSGTYKCVASAWSGGETVTDSDTIDITITVAEQDISYASKEISKTIKNVPFTNALAMTFVDPADGSGITYASSDESVATVDAATGEVTIAGVGTTTITATAAATGNCTAATASYTLTVTDEELPSTVRYAVKLWGINRDVDEEGNTLGLTFGPATGGNYINSYKAHLTKDQLDPDNGQYCIHWMSWEEIIAQSKKDPGVFADCLSNGCTKAVELTPNDKLFNQTTVANVLQQNYGGDGVGTLYYLLSGTTRRESTMQGEAWNYIYSGYSDADPANVYSRSRIRNILTGDKTELEEWITEYPNYNDYYGIETLCDENDCLLTCFPDELQSAIVPRETVNAGEPVSGTSYNDKTTYDQLFLFSITEVGLGSGYDYDDGGGTDYGATSNDASRYAYEFSGVDGATSAAQQWWTRSRSTNGDNCQASGVRGNGTRVISATQDAHGVSPGFCLEGPEVEEPTVSVTIESTLEGQDDTKTYDGIGVTLTAVAAAKPESAEILSYQWYGPDGEAIENATYAILNIEGNVSDSGTYKCVVTATNDGLTADADAEITITIKKAEQAIVFEKESIEKTPNEGSFTNELSDESVIYGALSYEGSEPSVATVDGNGLVTITGVGETTITATAAGSDEGNYDAVSAYYTLTVAAVDKTALQAEYDEDSKLIESDYTKESWEPFEEALNIADSILTGDTATQDEVNAALGNLQSVKKNLQAVTADKGELEAAIQEADDLIASDYTEESWAKLQEALSAAEEVDEDMGALQSAVNKDTQDLKDALDGLQAKMAEKSALEDEISAAEDAMSNMDSNDYTDESWTALEEALDAAKTIDGESDVLQSAVDAATQNLKDAFDDLKVKTVDKGALEDEITAVEDAMSDMDSNNYTDESWTALEDALDAAKTIDGESDVLQSAVDAATQDLKDALDNLQAKTAEKSALEDEISAVEDAMSDMDSSDYTDESWTALEDALEAAKTIDGESDVLQSAVNAATQDLKDAFDDLKAKTADKTALEDEITAVEDAMSDMDPGDYTDESWTALEDALEAAKAIDGESDVLQSAVNAATQDLKDALGALEVAPADKDALNAVIDAVETFKESKNPDDYTTDSWNDFVTALEDAQSVSNDPDVKQSEVNAAELALLDALAGLEPVQQVDQSVDKDVLNAAIMAAEALQESNYTTASWDNLQALLDTAKEVAESGTTQSDIDDATIALVDALAALELVGDSGTGGSTKNGLYQITPGKEWGYYKDGEVDTSYTGFQANANGTWYVENGYIHFDKNSVYKDMKGEIGTKGDWYYVVGNKVQYGFTGLANYKNANGWWYIKSGKVDFTHNGVDKNVNGWWYVTGGKVQFGFTGLANYKNANGWWYIKGGKVDFTHNGVDKNKNGWWYVTGGKVQFGFTGLAHYRNANGWWYVNAGKVNFNYSGIATNQNGTWYLRGGKVQFDFSGTVSYNGRTHTVRNGKVT